MISTIYNNEFFKVEKSIPDERSRRIYGMRFSETFYVRFDSNFTKDMITDYTIKAGSYKAEIEHQNIIGFVSAHFTYNEAKKHADKLKDFFTTPWEEIKRKYEE